MKRKRFLFAGLAAGVGALSGTTVKAQNYTAGDLVVYRVDNNGATLSNLGSNVFLDEYTPAGTPVFSQDLTTTNAATSLVASGTATSEGELNLSADGTTLFATGYNALFGTNSTGTVAAGSSIAGSASATVPREVVSVSGSQGTTVTTINNYTGNNIRSATALSATSPIYTSGANTGILSVTAGSSGSMNTGTLVSSTVANTRAISISGGNLYFSYSATGGNRIDSLGAASAPGSTATGVSISGGGTSPYSFVFATLGATATSPDTLYIADTTAGIQKYSLSSGVFTLVSTTALSGVTGLIGTTVNGVEQLYATAPGSIDSLTDASGAGNAVTASLTTLATVPTGDAFRGIAFAPSVASGAVPEPSTWAASALGALGLFSVRRVRRSKAFGA